MLIARSCGIAVIGAALALALSAVSIAGAAGLDGAVTTPGTGVLTKCRDWLVYASCNTYHHVALPRQVAIGDNIHLVFGSNVKKFTFHVVQIRRHANSCTLLDDNSGPGERGDKIIVTPCEAAAPPAASSR